MLRLLVLIPCLLAPALTACGPTTTRAERMPHAAGTIADQLQDARERLAEVRAENARLPADPETKAILEGEAFDLTEELRLAEADLDAAEAELSVTRLRWAADRVETVFVRIQSLETMGLVADRAR